MFREAVVRLTCRLRVAVIASAVAAVVLTPVAAGGDSSRSGFGEGGWVLGPDGVSAIAPQPDGKIVLVDGPGLYLVGLLSDGRINAKFGKRGSTAVRSVPCHNGGCLGMRVAAGGDGKIVIAQNSGRRSILTRWLGDGRLDRRFGTGGRVNVVGSAQVAALAVAPKGAIVAALKPSDPRRRPLLARFLADGRVDNRFGNGGRTRIASREPVAVLAQPDDKIVVAGKDVALARYLPDGSRDNSFGTNSTVRIKDFDAYAAALDSDGSIVVSGISRVETDAEHATLAETQVIRVLPDGRFDQRFGRDGVVGHDYGAPVGIPNAVAVLPHRAVVVAGVVTLGSAYKGSAWLSAVAKPDGSWEDLTGPRDCSSGRGPEYPALAATALAVARDGKVLIGGFSVCDTVIGRFKAVPDRDPRPPLGLDS